MKTAKMQWLGLLLSVFVILPLSKLCAEEKSNIGQDIYMDNCLICHGEDGAGAMPGIPDLTKNTSWLSQTNKTMLERLKTGVETPGSMMAMPPKGGNAELTDVELMSSIKYMKKMISN